MEDRFNPETMSLSSWSLIFGLHHATTSLTERPWAWARGASFSAY